jgi:DNA invertase Pin-like site-specific DNA recombinase
MKTANKYARHEADQPPDGLVLVPTSLGYARVSTEDQSLDVQLNALGLAGVLPENMYVEKISAVNAHRPAFRAMMKQLQRGDTVHVHSLSRLGRDAGQLRDILKAIKEAGARWKSWTEPHLDSATATGRLMINVTSAMAQFERDQVIERTKRGMDECRRKGMMLGRKRRISNADIRRMKQLRKTTTAAAIAKQFKCAVGTVYSYTGKL